jgi:2-keto-4-pentenoate hydratase/2-oxohepta-3-ene-1,7-dioic acid hydratase in catechol pathway
LTTARRRNPLPHGPPPDLVLPRASTKVDYEGELAMVIGRRCQNVPAGRAMEVVAGFTIVNDVSARDWQWRTPTFRIAIEGIGELVNPVVQGGEPAPLGLD